MVAQRKSVSDDPEFRKTLVARVRREIQQGVYETPEKLEIALERLIARIVRDGDYE